MVDMTFRQFGDGIGNAATVLRANATAAGLGAAVPTCPDWTVLDLVVHQGMVHRWTSDRLLGVEARAPEHEAAGRAAADVLDWFDNGATALLQSFFDSDEDLDVPFILPTRLTPRDAWARRQCHETTIHAVDAMSARLGRPPTADEVWFAPSFAVDGIDELLTGFLPRKRTTLRREQPLTLEVIATDTGDAWTTRISSEPPVTTPGRADGPVDATISAAAIPLHLGLWNRGADLECDDPALLTQWREQLRVVWG